MLEEHMRWREVEWYVAASKQDLKAVFKYNFFAKLWVIAKLDWRKNCESTEKTDITF